MTRRDQPQGDSVDWLDLDAPEPTAPGRPPGRQLPAWYLLVLVLILVAALIAVIRSGTSHDAAPPPRPTSPSPTPSPSTSSSSDSAAPSPTAPSTAPVITQLGRALLNVPTDWELFARSDDAVLRIQLARGRITSTPTPPLQSSGQVSFLAGRGRVIGRPNDNVAGFVVPDGKPAQVLTGAFNRPGSYLPGPDIGHLWMPSADGASLLLADWNGRPVGPTVTVRSPFSTPDGRGYPLFFDINGIYDAGPDGIHRVTTGSLVAVGRTRWLAVECDEQDRCSTVVIDRASGVRRVIGGREDFLSETGQISPDGSLAALARTNSADGSSSLVLVDLESGAVHDTKLKQDGQPDGGLFWSPDSRWLFTVHDAAVVIFDRVGQVRRLDADLPGINQITLRVGGS